MSKLGDVGKTILQHYPHGFFSLDQIMQATKLPRKVVTDALVNLSKDGIIKKIKKLRKEHVPGQPPRFCIIYRANRKVLAARIAPRLKRETVQDRMWTVIRKKKSIGLRDLTILAGVRKGMARWYLKAIRELGIIHASRSGGGPGVIWNLTKDVGVKRPYIKSNHKIDGQKMKEKAESPVSTTKKDARIHFWLSKAEVELSKKQALNRNLSVSAYFRMLLHRDGEGQKTPHDSL